MHQRPHIAVWGPLPPDRSEVANYHGALLAELAHRCEVEVFTAQPYAAPDSAFPVYPMARYTAQAIRQPFDLNIYQLSNSFQYGAPYYQELLTRPGLAVFHDLSLFELAYGLYMRDGRHAQFWEELEYAEGLAACTQFEAELSANPSASPPYDPRRYPMLRRAVEHSIGAIVHSSRAREQIRQYRPTLPVFVTEPVSAAVQSEENQGLTTDQDAAESARQDVDWAIVADQYYEAIEQILLARHLVQTVLPVPTEAVLDQATIPGLHFIGDLASADGLSESRLTMLEIMLQQHVPVHLQTLSTDSAVRFPQADDRLSLIRQRYPIAEDADYPIALLYANINELQEQDYYLWAQIRRQYSIAVWFWELSQLDRHAYDYAGRVDEIWVPSRFVAEPFSKVTGVPIQVIPPAVSLTVSPQVSRAHFGLLDNRYIFLFHFSAASGDGRKNPWACIDAFKKAFGKPGADGPLLVIKAHHLEAFPEMQTALRAAVATIDGVLIEDNYTRQQTNDLIACADAYVSLHRSEGFGLGMAEAMYLGKPVLGTDYSSSTDFLTAENGYPVRYRLRLIEADDHRYRSDGLRLYTPGQMWAEADVNHAAALMAMLYSNPAVGQAMGQIAAESIRRYCSPAVVGSLIRRRLIAINQQLAQ